jgi:hypothetical protein
MNALIIETNIDKLVVCAKAQSFLLAEILVESVLRITMAKYVGSGTNLSFGKRLGDSCVTAAKSTARFLHKSSQVARTLQTLYTDVQTDFITPYLNVVLCPVVFCILPVVIHAPRPIYSGRVSGTGRNPDMELVPVRTAGTPQQFSPPSQPPLVYRRF